MLKQHFVMDCIVHVATSSSPTLTDSQVLLLHYLVGCSLLLMCTLVHIARSSRKIQIPKRNHLLSNYLHTCVLILKNQNRWLMMSMLMMLKLSHIVHYTAHLSMRTLVLINTLKFDKVTFQWIKDSGFNAFFQSISSEQVVWSIQKFLIKLFLKEIIWCLR